MVLIPDAVNICQFQASSSGVNKMKLLGADFIPWQHKLLPTPIHLLLVGCFASGFLLCSGINFQVQHPRCRLQTKENKPKLHLNNPVLLFYTLKNCKMGIFWSGEWIRSNNSIFWHILWHDELIVKTSGKLSALHGNLAAQRHQGSAVLL